MIIDSSYFLPMMGLSILVAFIYANNRLLNETITWMEKEDELLAGRSYIKYYLVVTVRLLCVYIFFLSGKEINNTIKCWRENGKIVF